MYDARSVLYDEKWEPDIKQILTAAYCVGFDISWYPFEVAKIMDYEKGNDKTLADLQKKNLLANCDDVGLELHNESTGEIIYSPGFEKKLVVLIKNDELYDVLLKQ